MKLTRTNAIIQANPSIDLSAYIGCGISYRVSNTGAQAEPYDPDEGNTPDAVLIHVDDDTATLAMTYGGLAGTVLVKLTEDTDAGDELYAINKVGFLGFANAAQGTHLGNFYKCAFALESGVAGELVEAVLFKPEPITNA